VEHKIKPRVVAIIQARMGSTRLPGKILKEVSGKTLLYYLIERLRQSERIDQVVIATTTHTKDDVLVKLCNEWDIPVFRGSEEDVLERYYQAAQENNAQCVVRVTSDCPLIDPDIIDQTIALYLENLSEYDYTSNSRIQTFPRGMDVEVFSFDALSQAYNHAKKPYQREHVTPYLYDEPGKFRLGNLKNSAGNTSDIRLTVDTPEDFALVKKILEEIYPKNPRFRLKDIIELLKKHPDWLEINKHIVQKDGK
jgi:spore coat polysaccharide biosynthesis protein SpsF